MGFFCMLLDGLIKIERGRSPRKTPTNEERDEAKKRRRKRREDGARNESTRPQNNGSKKQIQLVCF